MSVCAYLCVSVCLCICVYICAGEVLGKEISLAQCVRACCFGETLLSDI